MNRLHVFCDFDGTIARPDSLELILKRHAPPLWRQIEDRVESGELCESEALALQFDLVEADEETALQSVEAEVRLDPRFPAFLHACRAQGVKVIILSGGFESIIRRLLLPLGSSLPEIRANDYAYDGSWRVSRRPYRSNCPGCNHCKALSVIQSRGSGATTILVGDGTTDLCAAFEADLVLAMGGLAETCRRLGRSVTEVEHFGEVLQAVEECLEGGPLPGPARINPIRRRYGSAEAELVFLEPVDR